MSEKANLSISVTALDLFLLCAARYNYGHNMQLTRPIHEKAAGLDRGGLAHIGNEIYYKALKDGVHFNDRVHAAVMKMREIASNPDMSNSTPEEADTLVRVMEQYYEYWRFEDDTLEILAVEEPFAYILFEDDNLRIIIHGKIDLLVNQPAIGHGASYENLPYDHKTYERDFPVARLSNQFMNYAAAVNSNFLIVNRIGFHKLDGKNPIPPEQKFKRTPLSYDPIILQEWKDNTTKVILEQYIPCVANESWPMNFTSCLKFNRLCEFYEICDSSGVEAKTFKLNNYITRPAWDMWKNENDGKG